jgi:predicted outer membrane repeat protein
MKGIHLAAAMATVLSFSRPALALTGTIAVTTTANSDTTSDGRCALVEAMKAANGTGTYHECSAIGSGALTITIPSTSQPISSSAALAPNKPLVISGAGLTATTINFTANTSSGCGVLAVNGANLDLRNLTLQQSSGLTLTGICGQTTTGTGPVITLAGVRVRSFQNSGVIMSAGDVQGTNVIIQNNHTFLSGGGIAILDGAQMETFTNLSLIGNFADGSGGGLYRTRLSSGNGNIYNGTISGNQAGIGGGIFAGAGNPYLEVHFTTIVSNTAFDKGGGIYVDTDCHGGTAFEIFDSVVASNDAQYAGPNFYAECYGFALSTRTLWGGASDQYMGNINSLGGDKTIIQDTVGTVFSSLSNTGAPYFLPAYPPRSTSDARNMAACGSTADVRGVSRPQGPGCDSGAWEVP